MFKESLTSDKLRNVLRGIMMEPSLECTLQRTQTLDLDKARALLPECRNKVALVGRKTLGDVGDWMSLVLNS